VRSEDTCCKPLTLLLSFQCHFCDKAFMNQAFLQSHIQRRHPADSRLGKEWTVFFLYPSFFPQWDLVQCISKSF
jgi:hypothetical protein